ncbi:MAG: hypothetical protein ACTSRG_10975 [Candidatus Helarchaeota archaeon]
MKNVYEKMTHYVNSDDKIAGYWTEDFLGIPIDIERGVFNNVFEGELKKSSMLSFRLKSFLKTLGFLIKKRQLGNFFRNLKILKSMGPQPMNLGIKTMDKRKINPIVIHPKDKKILLKKLLPKWKKESVVEKLQKEIAESGLIKKKYDGFFKLTSCK